MRCVVVHPQWFPFFSKLFQFSVQIQIWFVHNIMIVQYSKLNWLKMSLLLPFRISIILAQGNLRVLRKLFPVWGVLIKILQQISIREKLSSLIIASSAFLLMGTITALWSNPYFIHYDLRECMGLSNSQCRITADLDCFLGLGHRVVQLKKL